MAVLKVKADKFKRLLASDEASAPLMSFLHDESTLRVFLVDGAKEMACYDIPPAATKKKVLYLLKPAEMAVSANTFDKLIVGDISPRLLENMYAVLEAVYLPIMSNPLNQKACGSRRCPDLRSADSRLPPQGWPEVMSHEVLELFHKTVAGVYVALGQSVGMTLLPQPPAEMLVNHMPQRPLAHPGSR